MRNLKLLFLLFISSFSIFAPSEKDFENFFINKGGSSETTNYEIEKTPMFESLVMEFYEANISLTTFVNKSEVNFHEYKEYLERCLKANNDVLEVAKKCFAKEEEERKYKAIINVLEAFNDLYKNAIKEYIVIFENTGEESSTLKNLDRFNKLINEIIKLNSEIDNLVRKIS